MSGVGGGRGLRHGGLKRNPKTVVSLILYPLISEKTHSARGVENGRANGLMEVVVSTLIQFALLQGWMHHHVLATYNCISRSMNA